MTIVSGIVRDTQGNLAPNLPVAVKYMRPLVGYDGGAVFENIRLFTTSGAAVLTMALVPGHYEISVTVPPSSAGSIPEQIRLGSMTVLDQETQTLESALDQNIALTPNVVQQAINAAASASASADAAAQYAAQAQLGAEAAEGFASEAEQHAINAQAWTPEFAQDAVDAAAALASAAMGGGVLIVPSNLDPITLASPDWIVTELFADGVRQFSPADWEQLGNQLVLKRAYFIGREVRYRYALPVPDAPENTVLQTRSHAIALIDDGWVPQTGLTYLIGGLAYLGQSGATVIADLPGLVPAGDVTPGHFGITGSVLVPTHFPTLQAAFDALGADQKQAVTIHIEAGHAINSGLRLIGGDWSRYTITSADATVSLAAGFTGVNGLDTFSANSLCVIREAKGPRWSILVDMADLYGCGIVAENKSDMIVSGGDGVINAGAFGLYVNTQSMVQAANSNFSGAGWGNRVTVNALLSAPQANFSGTKNATYFSVNTAANLDVSRGSLVYVTGTVAAPTNLTGGAGRGLAVRRSFVGATNVDCSGNELDGLRAEAGSTVAFDGSIASGNTLNGVVADGSWVSFNSGGTATDNGNFNLFANNGGQISARNATLTGGGVQGVRAAQGSRLSVNGADCRRNGVSNQNTDIVVSEGSTISAVGTLGGVNVIPMDITESGQVVARSAARKIVPNSDPDINQSIDFDFPTAGTGTSTLRVWRDTVATGAKRAQFFRGDGSNTVDAQIGVGGFGSFFNSGNTGFNTANPQERLHVVGNARVDGLLIGGLTRSLRVEYGGTENAVTIATGAGITGTPPTGLEIRFRATASNTGPATIALDGGTARECRTVTGVALPAGYIRTGVDTVAVFDGTNWVLDRVIERGSNANGTFTRHADGSQTCQHAISLIGGGVPTITGAWIFPHPFVAVPHLSAISRVTPPAGTRERHYWWNVSPGTSSATLAASMNVNWPADTSELHTVKADGYWY